MSSRHLSNRVCIILFKRHINLTVICITVEWNAMLPKYGTKREQIEREEKRAKNWTLWDSTRERSRGGYRVTKADTESSISQVWPEPFQFYAPDAHPLLQMRDQYFMVKAKSRRITQSSESVAKKISLKTLIKADSVLCRVLKLDYLT